MPRIRTIKPEFFSHEDLSSKSAHARLLAIGLLTLADCKGRLRWVPMQVHAQVFPWEASVNIEVLLEELIDCEYLLHYEIDGKRYVEVVNFLKHQRLSGKEAGYESKIPAPPKTPSGKPPKTKKPNDFIGETGEEKVKQLDASPDTSPGSIGNPLGTGEHRNIGTGEQREREEQKNDPENPLSLSSHGKDPAFKQAWNAWIRKQAAKSGKMDPWTEQGQLKELERFAIEEAIAIVEYSTSRTNCVNLITNGDHKKKATRLLDSQKNGTTDDGYFLTDAQKKLANTKKAMEDFVNGN